MTPMTCSTWRGSKFPPGGLFGLRLDGRIMFPPARLYPAQAPARGTTCPTMRSWCLHTWRSAKSPLLRRPRCPRRPRRPRIRRRRHPDVDDACPPSGSQEQRSQKNGCRAQGYRRATASSMSRCLATEPGPKSDDPTKNGCPPPKDTDGDGIPDNIDQVPERARNLQRLPGEDGCPDEVPAA